MTSYDFDPLALAREIEERYRRYLQTRFQFRDPRLRNSFEDALRGGHLSKGPYLEATPVFEKAGDAQSLFSELLGGPVETAFARAVGAGRDLYWHQAESIRRVHSGLNVVIATGTGSGKTEAFLLPILLHLYQEHLRGVLKAGVRALVLYPMNALANDQRDRLGEICRELKERQSSFAFTFGQYTGDTPEDERDDRRQAQQRLEERLPGELVLREEMRKTPPHILLTNYSMLEYLLLRPMDSPLFDEGQARWWRFLVLDEAHQYRGAKGIEMGMLLRRLKERLRQGGRSEGFSCIATSATLSRSDDEPRAAVARFASDLFGEPFEEKSVLTGRTVGIPSASGKRLEPRDYDALWQAMARTGSTGADGLKDAASRVGVRLQELDDTALEAGRILSADDRSTGLREAVTGNPRPVDQLADSVFPDLPPAQRPTALARLVALLCRARDPHSDAPLLNARYHLFVRALEGAFVRLTPSPEIRLDRQQEEGKGKLFETALCHECGQHYFVSRKIIKPSGTIEEPVRDPGDAEFGVTYLMPVNEADPGQDADEGSGEGSAGKALNLCAQCGAYSISALNCGHGQPLQVRVARTPDDDARLDQAVRCDACGYTGGGRDPVRELVYGADGPHVVIATTLFQFLPPDRRKVLAFADGRQEAAFFAWYLEESYRDVFERHLLLESIQEAAGKDGPVSLETVHRTLLDRHPGSLKTKETDDRATVRANGWRAVLREFLTEERRLSLEGVGLVRWSLGWPGLADAARPLREAPFNLDEQEAVDALFVLLNTMREDRAVALPEDAGIDWESLGLTGRPSDYLPAKPQGASTRAWAGKKTVRADYLTRLAGRDGQEVAAAVESTLNRIWEAILDSDRNPAGRGAELLCSSGGAKRRLNPGWWRVEPVPDDAEVHVCDTCGRIQHVSVRGICARKGCSGRLKTTDGKTLATNHYRALYREPLPGRMRVEEHTAQIEHDRAREYQNGFKRGAINLLSCSTTFELGVDLGDLDVVFLRNTPPESFNYAQRVGRAGRRSGRPGFVVTYCRRTPHDLYHFAAPERMMKGDIRPPVLAMTNEKIALRHVTAVALAAFFRSKPSRFGNVRSFLADMENPSASADVLRFCEKNRGALEATLLRIVPTDIAQSLDIPGPGWPARVAGGLRSSPDGESRLSRAEAETCSDFRTLRRLEEDASSQKEYSLAGWARRRQKTIEEEDVLSLLSRKAVIPKYGFPVDVVELDTVLAQQDASRNGGVQLQRDLRIAISEFAPSAQLIANKALWTSYALKKVQEREWPEHDYIRCPVHNTFERRIHGQGGEAFSKCCSRAVQMTLLDPLFGFTTDHQGLRKPSGRPRKMFTSRPYFAGFRTPQWQDLELGPVRISPALPGEMAVVCEGRRGGGFHLCRECGAAFPERRQAHHTPTGRPCSNRQTQRVALGHFFVTDIVRLSFPGPAPVDSGSVGFAWSLAYALVEGAALALDVSSADLHCTVGQSPGEDGLIPQIFLYDDVPGGAGLVGRLKDADLFRQSLEEAHLRVSGRCGCGETESCYGCLRSYRNQFVHTQLQRGPVHSYLQQLLERL